MEDNLSRYLETESSKGSGSRDFAQQISVNPTAVVRIVEPESVIMCWRMWPMCEDGKKRPFTIANEYEGDSLLAKMLGDYHPYKYFKGGILESEKDEITNQKRFIHESQDPELFLQLCYNGDKSGNSGSWRPVRDFAFNAIDRKVEAEGDFMGLLWCVVHKQTKLLRMPITGFEKLKTLIEQNGKLDEYDIYYEKTGKGRSLKHNITKAGEKNPIAYFGFLTDEEKEYETHDLKKECALSSATYALKYLSSQIERSSSILGIDYVSQFEAQSKQEKELWGITGEEEEYDASQSTQQNTGTQIPSSRVPQSTPQNVAPIHVQSPVTEIQQPVQGVSVQTPIPPMQQPITQVAQTQVQQTPSQIIQAPVPPTVPVRGKVPVGNSVDATPATSTINCPFCQATVPDNIEVCSNCKNRLMEPCQKCNTMFSITATQCPGCGTVYRIE